MVKFDKESNFIKNNMVFNKDDDDDENKLKEGDDGKLIIL